jgi:hypothetical protein
MMSHEDSGQTFHTFLQYSYPLPYESICFASKRQSVISPDEETEVGCGVLNILARRVIQGWKGCNQSNIVLTSAYSAICSHIKLAKIVVLRLPTVYWKLQSLPIVWLITAIKVRRLCHKKNIFHSHITHRFSIFLSYVSCHTGLVTNRFPSECSVSADAVYIEFLWLHLQNETQVGSIPFWIRL